MSGTIESVHGQLVGKMSLVGTALAELKTSVVKSIGLAMAKNTKPAKQLVRTLEQLCINLLIDRLETLTTKYNLSVVDIIAQYFSGGDEPANTKEYYRIIVGECFLTTLDGIIERAKLIVAQLQNGGLRMVTRDRELTELEDHVDDIGQLLDRASSIDINISFTKRDYEVCKCGVRMTVMPELSELHCPDCARVKTIIGTVFRDDQFYPQEGCKVKHGVYDTARHYKFWIERLQAIETKTFSTEEMNKITRVLDRDNYERRELTCEDIRSVLKDPAVSCTHLNDHAPLLVKTLGGMAPPQLDFQENRLASIRFNRAMKLYDKVNPTGGNKPYYPYFIHKILEQMFKGNRAKLRILNYIHLQSRETVIKNDKYYEEMCELSDPEDGLVYTSTDLCGRF